MRTEVQQDALFVPHKFRDEHCLRIAALKLDQHQVFRVQTLVDHPWSDQLGYLLLACLDQPHVFHCILLHLIIIYVLEPNY